MLLSNWLDSPEPTAFELSMCENLSNGLKPAFDHLLRVMAQRNPFVFRVFRFKDEVYCGLLLLVERYYLSWYSSSFADNFYGLKRVSVGGGPDVATGPLSPQQKLASLVTLVFGPYLRHKLWERHAQLCASASTAVDGAAGDGGDEGAARDGPGEGAPARRSANVRRQLERWFVKGLPVVQTVYEMWRLVFQILFMFGRTKHYSPILWLQGIVMERLTAEDMQNHAAAWQAHTAMQDRSALKWVYKVLNKLLSALRFGLVGSAILFKLLEWYYSPENQAQRDARQGDIAVPPPPVPPRFHPANKNLSLNPKFCPICNQTRNNPAVASSGVVFCYKCIHEHVLEYRQCPVTGQPCDPLQIRRVFTT